MQIAPLIFAAAITAQPLVSEDVLEPSVLNEVDHALSIAPTNSVPVTPALFTFAALWETNGASATARAIALVSSQRGGRWFHDGRDVTPVAVRILRRAAGYDRETGAIVPELTHETFPVTADGTSTNRMIHCETNQLPIGQHATKETKGGTSCSRKQ